MKIAMWSGPRNLSTAMMYAFAARGDFAVWDEPFYAPWLAETGADHPMRDQVVAAHETDPNAVAERCSRYFSDAHSSTYMKHMPHHMAPGFPLDWAQDCVNIHLIRHPARVIASYVVKNQLPTPDEVSYARQREIFNSFPGPVVDSYDIRANPEGLLKKLCNQIDLEFSPDMLRWNAGAKPFDGAWAPHWYNAVHASTGFAGAEGPLPQLDGAAARIAEGMMEDYRALATNRLAV